ncbi:unnamed protein product [Didymodactylos carnosus]|uniref:Uncharacterized protein n=1 Tax=Didymodactylos carnosus TaxID=1234261 RepID=A0A814SIY4_9BILA|nr:unnamed protein product [Didymodactylos carnosus]CAF1270657.1 unnamed protein product [Didymodactylos carnosus]CAF3909124.1 unnamed protein product [Didymodactylos carnosus]CAF4076177.1 unnamed protein product [Didymodactylos carnosus]
MQFTIAISVFSILFSINVGLNIDEYVKEIDKLSLNETFVEEYYKWSFDLFSQPDYLYGEKMNFPCNPSLGDNKTTATSVHQLRPSDVKVIGALGDSLTAALGAHAITIAGLLVENRGLSWSIGGDHNFNKVMSLPNIVKQYTPNLKGYSTKFSISFLNGQNSSNNGLNVAKSGGRSYHMLNQAQMLIDRIKADKTYDFNNDWKVVTFFVGGNDLCDFCVDTNMHTPEEFTGYVRDALDLLHASLPRTFVNLVLVLDIR